MRNCYLQVSLAFLLLLNGCQLPGGFLQSDAYQRQVLEEESALRSLKLVDDYPLYTMEYDGPYPLSSNDFNESHFSNKEYHEQPYPYALQPEWSCTLFAALGDPNNLLFGRNFDWQYSPTLLLFTHPPDGYSSASMVDISFIGFSGVEHLLDMPLEEQRVLLNSVEMPFDGMNDQGLAVGMAAVPTDEQRTDHNKQSIDSLVFIREILDHAQNVDEAIVIIEKYNILWGNGPPLHYLIADRKGNSVLVEYYQGKMNLIRNVNKWHLATNFLVTPVEDEPSGICDRYDRVEKKMDDSGGVLTNQEGLDLLHRVNQPNTQWSVLYGMTSGEIRITMGSDRGSDPIIFQLK